ncbi:hypothetical protein V6N13_077430 [Hibiscus sabdariffa]|uniref:Uncharacterized protein n=1 Tax=Hibiscus sabdariffa TaxID=183260 RepID=A0ABR2CNU5_9ROSI
MFFQEQLIDPDLLGSLFQVNDEAPAAEDNPSNDQARCRRRRVPGFLVQLQPSVRVTPAAEASHEPGYRKLLQ